MAISDRAIRVAGLTGLECCACGHAVEEHGGDLKHPGSRACSECACIAYDPVPDEWFE